MRMQCLHTNLPLCFPHNPIRYVHLSSAYKNRRHTIDDRQERFSGGRIRELINKALAEIAAFSYSWIKGNSTQEWHLKLFRESSSTSRSRSKDFRLSLFIRQVPTEKRYMTIGTDKSTHILHDPEYSNSCFSTKVKFLPHIQ